MSGAQSYLVYLICVIIETMRTAAMAREHGRQTGRFFPFF